MTTWAQLRKKWIPNPPVKATADDLVRCESCERRIKLGDLIEVWADGVRTHALHPIKTTDQHLGKQEEERG